MTFHYDWRFRFPVSATALWPFVSNTNSFNRDAGVPHIERLGAAENHRQRVRMRRLGVAIEYVEDPFEWERPYRFRARRHFERGPLREMVVELELTEIDVGCELLYQVWAEPRNLAGRLAIPFQIGWLSRRDFARVFNRYAQLAAQKAKAAQPAMQLETPLASNGDLPPDSTARLAAIRERLARDHDPGIVDRFTELIRRGDELALAHIRPYVLADAWQAPRRRLLDLALSATRAGLVDLQWDVMCPLCRGVKDTARTLRELPQSVHCDACNLDFNASFEQAVELTFRPTQSIRRIEVYPFCIGGPQVTPHIVVQQLLAPGERRVVQVVLEPGRYRIRTAQLQGFQLIDVGAGPDTASVAIASTGFDSSILSIDTRAEFELSNQTPAEQLVIIENTRWSNQTLTAAEVTALHEFRDLFSSEVLRQGDSVSVGSLTVLFTDLRNSTRLYREIGDATAFGRVLDHFAILRAALEPEEGALVKTIGDAVMAVFRRPAGAVRAILRAQEMLAAGPDGVQPPFLKAGAHTGPCIGVTLNDRLDYFGSTVNIAARLGSESRGGEIVVSDAVRNDPEVIELIEREVIRAERFEARLKGFEEEPYAVWRITSTTGRWGQC